MSFTGTCTLPDHAPNAGGKALDAYWTAAELHGHPGGYATAEARRLTFTDGDAWHAHVKACKGHTLTYDGTAQGTRGPAYKGKPVASTRYRPFTPELGEVGSWVTMSDGTVGQVWSTINGGKSPRVYVATGTEYRDESVRHLSPASDPAEQLTITPEPSPEPVTHAPCPEHAGHWHHRSTGACSCGSAHVSEPTPEPEPSPVEPIAAPEPVLAAAIESGHAMIVPVGFSAPSPEPSEVACVGFADCPCHRCRATRKAASAAHPDHGGITRSAYCEPCQRKAHEDWNPEPSPEPVTCQADSGSATDCQPICDTPATREVTYTGYRGPYVTRLCDRHADQESARVYPETVTSDEPVTEPVTELEPEPSPEPVPNVSKLTPSERKVWNRDVADLARERDQYRAVMDAWTRVTELRLAGVSPADAVSAILGPVSNVSPIRGTA